jgi:4-hydroxybenzoate polyprenyltransferase
LLVQLSCTLLLWFYSTWFKRQYVSGNVVVALLSAATVLVLLVYEPVILHRHRFGRPSGASLAVPALVLLCYAFFAFMLTWMREIVKDMEDLRGDEANGCKTMPILKGLQYSRNFALALGVLVMISLGSIAAALLSTQAELLMAYLVVIAMAIGYWGAFMLRRNTSSGHYRTASRGLKAIMLLGIFSLVLYYFQSAVYNDL